MGLTPRTTATPCSTGRRPATGEDYPDITQVRDALLAEDIIPVFAVTSDVFSTYQDLVAQLGFGTVVELASDSSNIVSAVNNALDFVGNSTVIENAQGTEFADTITGNAAANTIWGNGGRDTLYGGDGKDVLYGGNGGDIRFSAVTDDDRLVGGAGHDRLSGGAGADTFVFGLSHASEGHRNAIVGFDPTEDKIDTDAYVTGVDAPVTGYGTLEHLANHAHLAAHHAVVVNQLHHGGGYAESAGLGGGYF